MTVLSQINAEKFVRAAKSVFPENMFFDPLDYYSVFNNLRDIPLGKDTYKKYMAIVCDSRYFPELSRARNNRQSPYKYFIDTTGSGEVTLAPEPEKPKLSSSISDDSLINFAKKLEPLMSIGRWYLPSTLGRYYNKRYKKHLRPDTIKDYMSQVFRRGLWGTLDRKSGRRNAFSYRISSNSFSARRRKKVETDSSPHSGVICALALPCERCRGENPEMARFCMYCGQGLRISLKVVVQESVFTVPVNMAGKTSPDDLISLVRGHISCHAEVVVVDGERVGEKVYTVSIKDGADGTGKC